MTKGSALFLLLLFAAPITLTGNSTSKKQSADGAVVLLPSTHLASNGPGGTGNSLKLDGLFFETAKGRTTLPAELTARRNKDGRVEDQVKLPDGRLVKLSVRPEGNNFTIALSAQPDAGIIRWGVAVDAASDEFFTGLMERLVDGPQQATWAPGHSEALNLRGEKVDMILKPTLSVYAPFYLSSRGYAVFVQGDWPGHFDFCADDAQRVKIEFEGPSFDMKVYTADNPAELVRAHSLDAGPPFLPPKWMYSPWRWRDENTQRATYYDGTPVTGPFNSEFMEDVLMMKAPVGAWDEWLRRFRN